ncbi:uncharacterized protein DEA37_0005103 [Paragonimus westermani]|uniref:FERM central domain-containing protein n=1 Tax=Paragonimus westermani TaxID=34504 RepID=A0A5J4P0W3_9TREM|nr:uncharacterized protein DEA37_0005103 [Paragonimus westermani]
MSSALFKFADAFFVLKSYLLDCSPVIEQPHLCNAQHSTQNLSATSRNPHPEDVESTVNAGVVSSRSNQLPQKFPRSTLQTCGVLCHAKSSSSDASKVPQRGPNSVSEDSRVPPLTLTYQAYLGVQYYPLIPSCITEEQTRYQIFLQVRSDLLSGRMQTNEELFISLCGLILQSDCGDYGEEKLGANYVRHLLKLPQLNTTMEKRIKEKHIECRPIPSQRHDAWNFDGSGVAPCVAIHTRLPTEVDYLCPSLTVPASELYSQPPTSVNSDVPLEFYAHQSHHPPQYFQKRPPNRLMHTAHARSPPPTERPPNPYHVPPAQVYYRPRGCATLTEFSDAQSTAFYSVRTDPVTHRHNRRLSQHHNSHPRSSNASSLQSEFNTETRFKYHRRSFPKTKHYLIEEPVPALPIENGNWPPERGQYSFIRPHNQHRQTSSRLTERESCTFSPKLCADQGDFDFQTTKHPETVAFVSSYRSQFENNHHQHRQTTLSHTPLVECRDKSFTMPILDARPSSRQQFRAQEPCDFDYGPRYYDYLADQSPDLHIQQAGAASVRSSTVSVLDQTPERISRPPTRLQRRSSDLSSSSHSGSNNAITTAKDRPSYNWRVSHCAHIHSQLSTDVESQPPSLLRSSTTQDSELAFADTKSVSDFLEEFHLPPTPVCSPNPTGLNGYQLTNSGDRYPESALIWILQTNLPSPPSQSFLKHLQTQSPIDLHSNQRTFNDQCGTHVGQRVTRDTGLASCEKSHRNQSIRVRQLPLTPPERVTQNQQKMHQLKVLFDPHEMYGMDLSPRFHYHTAATACSTTEVLPTKTKDPGAYRRSGVTSPHSEAGSHFDEVFESQNEKEDQI